VEPDFNVVEVHHLERKQKMLTARLQEAGVDWSTVEEQTWEVQEYLGYCPIPTPYPHPPADPTIPRSGDGDVSDHHRHRRPPPPPPPPFRIFVYPSAGEGKLPAIYQAVRAALMASPYRTLDPGDATIFIPPTDVSCWCERCLGKRPFEAPSPESQRVTDNLRSLAHWGKDGKDHVIFEFSDVRK